MGRKGKSTLVVAVVLTICLTEQVMALPDLSGLIDAATDVATGISDAAESTKEAVSNAAGKAGEVISNAAGEAGILASNTARQIGDFAAGAAGQVQDIASGFASGAGQVLSNWADNAGVTADNIKKLVDDAGISICDNATELGALTVKQASKLTVMAGGVADNTINAVSGAGNLVIDQAGHVVDLAAVGIEQVTKSASVAYDVLQSSGETLMKIAEDAVASIDLNDQNNWDLARTKVDEAIEKAVREGLIGKQLDMETVHCVTRIVFGVMMYGHQYSSGQINLGDYAALISEVIIREGLPTGVGFVVSHFYPPAEGVVKEATYYIISVAYSDKSGTEIKQEEEALIKAGAEETKVLAKK